MKGRRVEVEPMGVEVVVGHELWDLLKITQPDGLDVKRLIEAVYASLTPVPGITRESIGMPGAFLVTTRVGCWVLIEAAPSLILSLDEWRQWVEPRNEGLEIVQAVTVDARRVYAPETDA